VRSSAGYAAQSSIAHVFATFADSLEGEELKWPSKAFLIAEIAGGSEAAF
jgi:hypothetical protein